jgi:hypothetical protein
MEQPDMIPLEKREINKIVKDENANKLGFLAAVSIGILTTFLSPIMLIWSLGRKLFTHNGRGGIHLPMDLALQRPEPFVNEATEEFHDALSPMYDQLAEAPKWWILEYLPMRVKKERAIYESSDRMDDYSWRLVVIIDRKSTALFFNTVFIGSIKAKDAKYTSMSCIAE